MAKTQRKIKEAPHSKESEMMVLGCMLTSINSLNIGSHSLDVTDFYFSEHKILFQVLKSAYKQDKPADVHLVCEELKRRDELDTAGGVAYITTLAQYAGTSAYIEEYCDILKNKSILRRMLRASKVIEKHALDEHPDAHQALEEAQALLTEISNHGSKEKFPIQFLDRNEFLFRMPPPKPMLLEYLLDNEKHAGFLPKGIVGMLAGAGGVGKTHLLAQLAIAIASKTPFLNIITPIEQGNVFIGLGENQYDDIHRVLYKASQQLRAHQPDLTKKDPLQEASERIAVYSFCGQQAAFIDNGGPSRYFRELKMRLIDQAPEAGWSLIILDPVSRLLGADAEVDNAAATQFISLLEELTIVLPGNPTVLFAHHVNKAAINAKDQNQTAARGSSALTDGVRWQMNLTTKEGEDNKKIPVLKMTKSNFTPIIEEICLARDINGYLALYATPKPINAKQKNG
jgi:hypothetical protein